MIKNKPYIAIALTVITYTQIHSMYNQLAQCGQKIAVIGIGTYIIHQAFNKYIEIAAPNFPPAAEQWARKTMAAKGIENANTIPLKMGDQWAIIGGKIIIANKKDIETLENDLLSSPYAENYNSTLQCEASLGHESGHYEKNHNIKIVTLYGAATGIALTRWNISHLLKINPYKKIPALRGAALLSGYCIKWTIALVSVIGFTQYHENEADEFASKTARTPRELRLEQNYFMRMASSFEDKLLNKPETLTYNPLKKLLFYFLSKKINRMNDELTEKNHLEQKIIKKKQKTLIKTAYFFYDWRHPYLSDRAKKKKKHLQQRSLE